MNRTILHLVTILASVAATQAQYGGYNGNYNPYNGDSGSNSEGSSSSSGSGSGSGSQFGTFQGGAGFDIEKATRVRAIHGILAAVAMVILFPSGSILVRLLPGGPIALWGHALAQVVALCVLAAAVGFGIHLVRVVRIPVGDGDIMSNTNTNYHPIIGLVVLACLLVQPVLGYLHHAKFKRVRRRQIWSYLHLFNGRVFVTLGIANGGLGLWMARASGGLKTAYIASAAVMWSVWMLAALWGEWKIWRFNKRHRNCPCGDCRRRKLNAGEVSF